jgi:hypothetical protein
MKFTIPAIVLFITSNVNANKLYNLLNKREMTVYNDAADTLNLEDPYSVDKNNACFQEFSSYSDCLDFPTVENYKNNCTELTTGHCEKFFTDTKGALPSCDLDKQDDSLLNIIKSVKSVINITCLNDENGKICSISERFLYELNEEFPLAMTEQETYNLFNATCESEVCRKASYDAYIDMLNDDMVYLLMSNGMSSEDISEMKAISDVLKSEECLNDLNIKKKF